jgi:FkbM family methyltransferase
MQPSRYERLLIAYARHFPIRRGKMRVIDALWRSAANAQGTQRVANLRYARFKMPCDLSEMLQRQFYFFGTYFLEEQILDCWEDEARSAEVVFDVGANAGIYSLAALAINPNTTVHAFEPTPEIATRLRATAKLNGLDRLHVHELAVSSDNGFATLRRYRGDLGTNEGMNYISADLGESSAGRLPTVCLDQFCADHAIDRVDLLKLDIQGNEPSALAGAKHLLATGAIGTIFTELNWGIDATTTSSATESIRLLEEVGYRFSKPRKPLSWKESGKSLWPLSDVVASRAHQDQKI